MTNDQIHIRLFSSGYCTGNTKHIFPKEPSKETRFHATWALIRHPELKNILFDTGYSSRFHESTKWFPNRIYRLITPVFHNNDESCINQLLSLNITPDDIQNIVISHFHADHIAGLKDFPSSKIWCSRKSLAYALSKNKCNAVFKGILKPLIPDNILKQAMFPEDLLSISSQSNLLAWKWSEDLYFVDLPGHYRGQLGLYLKNTNMGDLLLCADAAWSIKSIREKIYPSRLVSLIIDDFSQLSQTIDDLYNLQMENPEVKILPTHCNETLKIINS